MKGIRGTATAMPLVDRKAFNYGRGLAWSKMTANGENPPQEYVRTDMLAAAIEKRRLVLSQAAWALTEAMSYCRQAETDEELQAALADLRRVRAANDPLGIDGTFNVANMPDDASPIGDAGNGHVFFEPCDY